MPKNVHSIPSAVRRDSARWTRAIAGMARRIVRRGTGPLAAVSAPLVLATAIAPAAIADNFRLNNGVVAHVYALQQMSGCAQELHVSPQLRLAAQWHTNDLLKNPGLDSNTGSDGSTPQDRASRAGYQGTVAETVSNSPVAVANSALASSEDAVISPWVSNPTDLAILLNCANTQIGVWSENTLDRTILVAVYGSPTGH